MNIDLSTIGSFTVECNTFALSLYDDNLNMVECRMLFSSEKEVTLFMEYDDDNRIVHFTNFNDTEFWYTYDSDGNRIPPPQSHFIYQPLETSSGGLIMDIFTKLHLSTVGEFTLTITTDHITMVDSDMNRVYYRNRHRPFEYSLGSGDQVIMNKIDS